MAQSVRNSDSKLADPAGKAMRTNRRGFAAMSPEKQLEISRRAHAKGTAHKFTKEERSLGGKTAHANGTAPKWTKEEARIAGRLGGIATNAKGKAHKWTKEEAILANEKAVSKMAALRCVSTQEAESSDSVNDAADDAADSGSFLEVI